MSLLSRMNVATKSMARLSGRSLWQRRTVTSSIQSHHWNKYWQDGGKARNGGNQWKYLSSSSSASSSVSKKDEDEHEFQAETRQLLDIVSHSLYTDKEVFLRELVSNASDALEKLRYLQTLADNENQDNDQDNDQEDENQDENQVDKKLEIHVRTDEKSNSITVSDSGVGMSKQDMISHLGTIAKSGSKAFVQQQAAGAPAIIGKFGVGFYSAFMVAHEVEVRSRATGSDVALVWRSTGAGSYSISALDAQQARGTAVEVRLREDQAEFAQEARVREILQKHSSFVGFPLFLNGERVNALDAVWLRDPPTVSSDSHAAFYRHVSKMYDDPLSTIHFRADAPIDINALLYVPSFHQEKYGMQRMEPAVSLYCRKVLVEPNSPDILPDWCRFLKGVVDSEDLPLSISREKPQDTNLLAKIKKVLVRKIISHFATMARKDPEKFQTEFYKEYAFFLKEGICQDYDNQQPLSKLLYFETFKHKSIQLISLDEYISQCSPEQTDIYYLCAPSRELALQSPYMEAFQSSSSSQDVIFVYSAIDDFVMANLKTYEGRNIRAIDTSDINKNDSSSSSKEDSSENNNSTTDSTSSLTSSQATQFCSWFQQTLPDKVSSCQPTQRLTSSPAIILDHESGAMRRMMRMVETSDNANLTLMPIPKQKVQINPNHEIIIGLNELRIKDDVLAKVMAEQVLDNCLIAAGLMDDARAMLPRLNDLMLCIVKSNHDMDTNDNTNDTQQNNAMNEPKSENNDTEQTDTVTKEEK